ncbi:alkaline phosphatase family protein [uncultured Cellulomonas sp.]|uniref:alkaline phosphatase family protein n=1 Tax=uncultured Cellulomonas sp. TaxID=189682 RepID=UPI00260994F1|nr:alkaline phosphatase family protein [uncultured Cellulomonas sp.]
MAPRSEIGGRTADRRPPGLLVVQWDGVPAPLLRQALAGGRCPVLGTWLAHGSHRLEEWWCRVPATTPASQAGLLHGTSTAVPAFRWFEKSTGRFLVSRRPADAARVERRLTNGRGLLADGGVSIGTMFSGDAPRSHLVVSRGLALGPTGGPARRRHRPEVPPAVRHLRDVALDSLSVSVLQRLEVALVRHEMALGTPVVVVDLVGYDERAHHAGPAGRRAVDGLAGLDAALGELARAAGDAPRRYRVVVLSDHGQSDGVPFRRVSGRRLDQVVRRPAAGAADDGAVVVAASGNLGLVWFRDLPERPSLATVAATRPRLVQALLSQPGVGFLLVPGPDAPVVVGARGARDLGTDAVDGVDPLRPFGPRAVSDLRRLASLPGCADVVVHSTVDAGGTVHPFEELVGSHGGLGGPQNRAFLAHPTELAVDADLLDRTVPGSETLVGAEAVHVQLVRWLADLGLRTPERDQPVPPSGVRRPGAPARPAAGAGA